MKMKKNNPLWYDTVPLNWNIRPLKYITLHNQKVLYETTRPDYTFRYVDIGSVSGDIGISEYKEMIFADAPSRARRIVSVGDTMQRRYVSDFDSTAHQVFDVLHAFGCLRLTDN